MGLKVLSLFDGIGCARLALDKLNIPIESYFASEIDKYAIKIATNNYSDIIEIGDIRNISYKNGTLTTDNGIFNVDEFDLVCGGSPCQSFTFAGKRQGMSTSSEYKIVTLDDYLKYKNENIEFLGQSYLFWEYMRLLNEIKPKYFFLENVKMEKEWRDIISFNLNTLPIEINSNCFSAQNRQRLYWTNIKRNILKRLKPNETVLRNIVSDEFDIDKYSLSKEHYNAFLKSYNWKSDSLNNKSKPLLASYFKQPPHCPYIPSNISDSGFRRLSPIECERLQTLPDNYTKGISDSQRYKCIGNGWTVDVIVYLFSGLCNCLLV